jgi:5'-methylthioadenosine phosphorylase
MKRIGIIGGSGLYDMDGVTGVEEVAVSTPFGAPSDAVRLALLDGHPVAFLPRHGRGHLLTPTEINYRANIWALKSLGVDAILSVSAVGSMREDIVPGQLVLIDQFIDRTKGVRAHTFFGDGCVGHVGFGDPICKSLLPVLTRCAAQIEVPHHVGGTYVCIEGPQFSTRAESHTYRSWNVSVIGMTNLTEAKLAREAEIHYATIAMATDYDVWHAGEDDVSVEQVLATLRGNVGKATHLIRAAVPELIALTQADQCSCESALEFAVMTDPAMIPSDTRERLSLLMNRYWSD